MRQAQGNDVMVRFFLTEEERTPATDEVRGVHASSGFFTLPAVLQRLCRRPQDTRLLAADVCPVLCKMCTLCWPQACADLQNPGYCRRRRSTVIWSSCAEAAAAATAPSCTR